MCVRNLDPNQVLEKAVLLQTASGEKLKKSGRAGRTPVRSMNEGVRGLWSPFHGNPFKI